MQTDQILTHLGRSSFKLPVAALEAATADRTRLAPQFIAAFERFAETDVDEATSSALFFKFHLLAEWRETAAYRPLCRFLRCAPDRLDNVLGECITTTAHRVISAVFDGDPTPMFDVILDLNADEYIRWNMCETLAHLVLEDRLDRAIVTRFLRDCFSHIQPQSACHVWDGWAFAVSKLGLVDFQPILESVYTRGYADSSVARLSDVERELAAASDPIQLARWRNDRDHNPFTDAIAEMSGWYCFSKEAERDHKRAERNARSRSAPVAAIRKLAGRNEPCPCGSGKKYKKCCLN